MSAAGPSASPGEREWGKVTSPDELTFLQGPQTRRAELRRALRIFFEFLHGFRRLHFLGPAVTVFGSSRFGESHPHYETARQVGRALARRGFTVMTGGGPGIMEAANRGAREVGGHSVGCNIELPHEQRPNAYLDDWITFRYFFVRKVMLVKYSYAFFALPGGYGTLDEIFETATLIQTRKIQEFPLVLVGTEFWQPLLDFIQARPLVAGTISPADFQLLHLSDDVEASVDWVAELGMRSFGLGPKRRPRPRRAFGERSPGQQPP